MIEVIEDNKIEDPPFKEMNHYVFPDNEDLSYCGLDMANEPWVLPGEKIDCPECLIRVHGIQH